MIKPILLLTLLSTACTYVQIDKKVLQQQPLSPKEKLVVLYDETTSTEIPKSIKRCIDRNMQQELGSSYIASADIVAALFPWLEPQTSPKDPQQLLDLFVRQPHIAEQFKQLGIYSLAIISGENNTVNNDSSLACSNFGCYGLLTWTRQKILNTTLWRIDGLYQQAKAELQGQIVVDASGTSYVPAVIVPLPFIAYVRKNSCLSTVQQIADFVK